MVEATRQRLKPFYIHCDISLEILFSDENNKSISFSINDFYLDLPLLTNCKYDPIL